MSAITLTDIEANAIADALLAGCLYTTTAEHEAGKGSFTRALAANTHAKLRDAMLLLEGRIAQVQLPPDSPSIASKA